MASPARCVLAAAVLLFAAAACRRGGGTAPREPAAAPLPAGTPARRVHEDRACSFEAPAHWVVQAAPANDAQMHTVELKGPGGLWARLVLLPTTPVAGLFVEKVIGNLRRSQPDLRVEPCQGWLAERPVKGFRYQFQADGVSWEGRAFSYSAEDREACALGQFPAGSPGLDAELGRLFRSLRLKASPDSR